MDQAEFKTQLKGTIEHLESEFRTLRTGRAHPGIIEELPIEAYGNMTTIKGVASITVADPRTLLIDPWDKSLVSAVEKAIQDSDQGLNPQSDGKVLRIPVPQPTEETRKEMVKVMKKMTEEARIRIRRARDDAKSTIIRREKDKEISEDDRYHLQELLESDVKDYNNKVEELSKIKEGEIMKV